MESGCSEWKVQEGVMTAPNWYDKGKARRQYHCGFRPRGCSTSVARGDLHALYTLYSYFIRVDLIFAIFPTTNREREIKFLRNVRVM